MSFFNLLKVYFISNYREIMLFNFLIEYMVFSLYICLFIYLLWFSCLIFDVVFFGYWLFFFFIIYGDYR